jgi:lysophospholipase L1-like esterase
LILVSLGSNDAVVPSSVRTYESNYRALLEDLARLTSRRAILAIPLPEAGFEKSKQLSSSTVEAYNEVLPSLAEETHAIFIPLPAMPDRHTIDGVHLNTEGYKVWDGAVISGLDAAVCNEGASPMSPIKSSKPPNSALRPN